MITAYYTKDLKYLQKGAYKKIFEVDSIAELLSKIKVQDKILVKAVSKDIFNFKFNTNTDLQGLDIDFEVINEVENVENPIFDYASIERDYESEVSYAKYSVAKNWQYLLGDEVYFCRERNMQLYLVKTYKRLCFLFTDLMEVKNGLLKDGEIPEDITTRMYLTDDEIAKGSPTVENLLVQRVFDGKEVREWENT